MCELSVACPHDHVIQVESLVKTFGKTRALDGLDLTVETGEVHGFLGPNGAGKSTTIRVLLGLLRADGGTARCSAAIRGGMRRTAPAVGLRPGDVEPLAQPDRRRGHRPARPDARRPTTERRRADLIERFDLDPTKKGRAYSKGNRQKVALVAALAADVELLILDEPTSGLDPLMEQVFRQCIDEEQRGAGPCCCRATSCPRWRRLCDRVSIVRAGRTVETGTLARLCGISPGPRSSAELGTAAGRTREP